MIGPYKLLQEIGEGGMGVVFMAEQTRPVQRTVALKIIKPGMDTRQVVARFEAERQAVALMDHPSIARVLDAGTTDTGRPYFVMDLVKGVPITEYCDQQRLSVRQRLELMGAVCQAVQHAHQKGIIHRDVKPSNVLVAEYDGKPVPKIIDFGVAKATAQRLTDRTMFTQYGQVIGTFEYMSPEQARFNQLDVDTRTDIYALGVLLYELLTGSTPFEKQRLETAPFDETMRIIREEEPPMPSTRLSAASRFGLPSQTGLLPAPARQTTNLVSIAANRNTEPAKLSKEVRGELDWIVMKALEKDRNRRYETVGALAADVMHYLADEPVTAIAPTPLYRAGKFVRRNKAAMLASLAVLVGIIAGIIGTTVGLVGQSRQRAIAERERAEAQLNLASALQQQSRNAEAEQLYRQALATASDMTPQDRQRAARTLLRLAQVVGQRGEAAESEQLYRRAISAYRVAFAPGDANIAHALTNYALVLRQQERWNDVEPMFREAYDINREASPSDHRVIGISAVYLGHALLMQKKYAEAEPLLRASITQYQLVVPPDEYAIALARVELGRDLSALGRRPEAESHLLNAERVLASTADFYYAATALAAFYTSWDQLEPGKGYDGHAREWLFKLIKKYLPPKPVAEKTTGEPATNQN